MTKPIAWKVDQLVFSALSSAEHHANIVNIPITPLYTHPMRELTEWEIKECWEEATEMREHFCSQYFDFAQLILKKASEK